MLSRVIALSLKNAALVVAASALLIAATVAVLPRLPVDVFPELNAPTVTIMTESGGLGAAEVEQYVSFPIESAVNGLPGLRRVRSASALGLSIVWAEFGWDTDLYRARQMVAERVAAVQESLPEDTHMELAPVGSITGEIMLISLKSPDDKVTPMELRALAEYDLRNRLLTVSGIAQVVSIGGFLPEYQVEVRQEDLQLHGLTTAQVAEALGGAHNLTSAGFLANAEGLELPLAQDGQVRSLDDIKRSVVAVTGGAPVTVADIADVRLGPAFRRGAASDSGAASVILSIQKAPNTNTLLLTQELDALLEPAKEQLAERGIVLDTHVFRQADFIQRSVDNVTRTLVEATVIVIIILMLFLMNWRTTVITLTALPLSLGAALIFMWWVGMSIDVMTLGGLAVAIGILVDDAIIDVENVHRRLNENAALPPERQRGRMRVIFDASNEIRSSVLFATIIICLVFVPLLFLEGLEGRFFQPLGLTYIISVLASLVVAMTVTPALCWYLLRGGSDQHGDGAFVRVLKRGYRPLLAFCLRWKKATLAVSGIAAALSLAVAARFGTSFLPEFNEGVYTVFLMMPPGSSLEESERIALGVQQRLLEIPGIEHIASRSGRAERDAHAEPPSSSEMEVRYAIDADPLAIRAAIDQVLSGLPGVTTNIGQPISHRLSHILSGTPAQIAMDIYGDDLEMLRKVAKDVQAAVAALPSARDVVANREVLIQTLAIAYRTRDLARYGLTAAEAGEQVRRAVFGDTITTINDGIRRYDLVLRLASEQRDEVADLDRIVLTGKDGALVRLHEVADIGPQQASNLISRQNARRKTVISANVAVGANLGDAVAAIKAVVDPIVAKAGCTVEYGGQFQAQQSASRTILGMGSLVLVLLIMLLQMALGALRPALLVLFNLPLALIGGVMAMFWSGSEAPFANFAAMLGLGGTFIAPVVSIATLVGFITLFGIATRNGILLVNHVQWLLANEEPDLLRAVIRGSEERLVPVLMTALCAALGLLPLALKAGQPGSELLAPLAVVVLGGLISSTLLNMLVVPAGYLLFCGKLPVRTAHADDDLLAPAHHGPSSSTQPMTPSHP